MYHKSGPLPICNFGNTILYYTSTKSSNVRTYMVRCDDVKAWPEVHMDDLTSYIQRTSQLSKIKEPEKESTAVTTSYG